MVISLFLRTPGSFTGHRGRGLAGRGRPGPKPSAQVEQGLPFSPRRRDLLVLQTSQGLSVPHPILASTRWYPLWPMDTGKTQPALRHPHVGPQATRCRLELTSPKLHCPHGPRVRVMGHPQKAGWAVSSGQHPHLPPPHSTSPLCSWNSEHQEVPPEGWAPTPGSQRWGQTWGLLRAEPRLRERPTPCQQLEYSPRPWPPHPQP